MTTVLITGANRGIGRGLAESFLARPDHIVVAAVRDPQCITARSLNDVVRGQRTNLVLVKIENTSPTDPTDAMVQLTSQGIATIDTVIANAGIAGAFAKVADIKIDDTREMFETNTLPIITLFQAVVPFLEKSKNPKFIAISTNAASIVDMKENIPFLLGSYGLSKAAVNFIVRRIHFESDWLTAFVIHPGFAKTDMGNTGAKYFGMDEAIVPIDSAVNGILQWVDKAKRESESGHFYAYDGSEMRF